MSVVTTTLSMGMLSAEKRHIGFEGIGILVSHGVAVASLVLPN